MATHLKSKSFQRNLFLSVGGIFLLFAICFILYQHKRETQFKIDLMNARLQSYCYEMMHNLGREGILDPERFSKYVTNHHTVGLRITVVDENGDVLMDSSYPGQEEQQENHLDRKEIAEALFNGNGYDIKRTSSSTHLTYFYSATRFDDIVVRAAVPYSATLTNTLNADHTYLYFALILTLLLGIVLYINTSRISRHIEYLRTFARKAEQGEEPDHILERLLPDDELGEISHTITTLYWRLRHSEDDKTRLKRQLTQNATHELKTPATSINAYLESILENLDMDADKREHFLERCYDQSQRLCNLLQDMSTLTKLDERESAGTLQPEVVDVSKVINSVLNDVALKLEELNIKPILHINEHIPITGDRSLIYSIFRNIIDNSIAYATGADKITITSVEHEDEDDPENGGHYFEFVVSDNGPGVDAKHLPFLFERFYRVDKGRSREAGGTGLGLAIVKNGVMAHRGSVAAEITYGGGLTIRFTLKGII